ncbi:MAG: RHS repeat-associated core domain-containing protein, partial [Acidobacteriota bacterium]
GNLTPGDNQIIPGLGGPAIIGRVSSQFLYDRNSKFVTTLQDDGDATVYDYDGLDRVLRRVDPEGNSIEWAYDDNDNIIETREVDVAQRPGLADEIFLTTSFYDSLDRLVRQVDNLGQTDEYRYDSRNNLVAASDAQGPVTGAASIARRAFPPGPSTVNTLNDPGNVTLYTYDGINRLIREDRVLTASGSGTGAGAGADIFGIKTGPPGADPAQGGGDGLITILTDFDGNSLVASRTDDNGNQTRSAYDNLDRLIAETKGSCLPPLLADRCDPPTTISVQYDPDDNVVRSIDENGSITDSTYDGLNRLVGLSVTRAAGVVGTTLCTYEYDGLSRKTRATDNNDPLLAGDDVTTTWAYDSLSRPIEETLQIGALPVRAAARSWRAENLVGAVTYPDGRVIEQTFDGLDRLAAIADQGLTPPLAAYTYIGPHRVLTRTLANGTELTHLDPSGTSDAGYDGLRRPIELRHQRSDTSLIVGFTETYDRHNSLLSENKLHDPANSESFGYDSDYRLIQFQRPAPSSLPPLQSAWTLDGASNWKQVDAETREHSSFNEITIRLDGAPVPIISDDNGNLTDDGAFLYEWDFGNRLRRITRKSDGLLIATHAYDASGRRVRRIVTASAPLNGTTDYYYLGWSILEEHDGADLPARQYVYGNGAPRFFMNGAVEIRVDSDSSAETKAGSHLRLTVQGRNAELVAPGGMPREYRTLSQEHPNPWREKNTTYGAASAYGAAPTWWRGPVEGITGSPGSFSGKAGGNSLLYWLMVDTYSWRESGPYTLQPLPAVSEAGRPSLDQDESTLDEPLIVDQDQDGDGVVTGPNDLRLFYHQNTLSSTFALTDKTSAIREGYLYEPYGSATVFGPGPNGTLDFGGDDVVTPASGSQMGNPYLFTGRRFDAAEGHYYYRDRFYDPDSGRFLTRDPQGVWADDLAHGNGYTYAAGSPLNHLDPMGHDAGTAVVKGAYGYVRKRGGRAAKQYARTYSLRKIVRIEQKTKGRGTNRGLFTTRGDRYSYNLWRRCGTCYLEISKWMLTDTVHAYWWQPWKNTRRRLRWVTVVKKQVPCDYMN